MLACIWVTLNTLLVGLKIGAAIIEIIVEDTQKG